MEIFWNERRDGSRGIRYPTYFARCAARPQCEAVTIGLALEGQGGGRCKDGGSVGGY